MSLFDFVDETTKRSYETVYPDVGEYEKSDLLALEKEVLGIYVSGHPLEEQEATTGEIVRSVAQAADGTSTVTGNIADVSTAAQESGKAAEQVLGAASELAQKSGRLSAEITHFLDRVRAA